MKWLAALAALPVVGTADPYDAIVSKYVAEGRFEGVVLVAKGSQVLFHKAYGFADRAWQTPLTTDARFPLCQVTEQFTAALVLREVEKGTMRLDQTVGGVWPDLASQPAGQVTLGHLLGRRSGLTNVDGLGEDVSLDTEVVMNDVPWFWRTRDPRVRSMEGAARLVLERPPVLPPGMPTRSNSDYLVAGAMLERATGKPFAELVRTEILEPLGMAETVVLTSQTLVPKMARSALYRMDGWWAGPSVRWENAPALVGLCTTAADMLKWNRALLDGKAVPPGLARAFFGPAEGEFRNGFGGDWGEVPLAGKPRQVLDIIGAVGAYRAHSSLVVPDQVSVIILSGATSYNPKPIHRGANITFELAQAALAAE
jgi:CubicO group peptidase (beta-lactamase class C family)